MKSRPRTGETAEVEFISEDKHAIDFATEGMPSVLSTPWLISVSYTHLTLPTKA